MSRGIQSVGPIISLYTSLPDRPIHFDTNSSSLCRILATLNYARRLHNHMSTTAYSLVAGSHLYSGLVCDVVERTKMPKLRHGRDVDSKPGAIFCEEFPRASIHFCRLGLEVSIVVMVWVIMLLGLKCRPNPHFTLTVTLTLCWS